MEVRDFSKGDIVVIDEIVVMVFNGVKAGIVRDKGRCFLGTNIPAFYKGNIDEGHVDDIRYADDEEVELLERTLNK